MLILKVRPHSNAKRARDGYVQAHVDGRWRSNREFYVGCPDLVSCCADGIDGFEFVQVEDDADRELIRDVTEALTEHRPWFIAYGDVYRRCRVCGRYRQTHYGYQRSAKGSGMATIFHSYERNGWPHRLVAA